MASSVRPRMTHVPNRLRIEEGPDDDVVRLNVRIPRWLKASIAEAMASQGKGLNDWVRDALRTALPAHLRVRRRRPPAVPARASVKK